MYQIVLVEDNPEDADIIRHHLERYAKEENIGVKLAWYKSAAEFLSQKTSCDLIFMDIQLPGINGMEAATLLRAYDGETPLIFVTDLAQYAIKGYEVSALDFVVKPVGYRDFALRMRKALRLMERRKTRSIRIATRDAIHIVDLSELVYVDITNHNLNYHTDNGKVISCRGTLHEAERDLDNGSFTRISNNCLVNMRHIKVVLHDGLKVTGNEIVYFSRSRRKQALEDITVYFGEGV